ncbi:FAD-dependent monooxygenase [Streptomyces sp. NPDC049577]|uniref:FAD-dependent monooxygenase n=1 Tax=Streptomyces sp. NPDC049577 TaxID=3155153 RepID=UPI003445E0EC
MEDVRIPVLIVGGGPVGLSTALFCARHGVATMLLEKRDGTSTLPRAPGMQARTLEMFRAAGLGGDIRALEIGDSHPYFEGGIIQVETFSRIDEAVLLEAPSLDGPTVSPERVMGCGQDRYERVLAAKARELGSDIRFGTRLLELAQDDEGVTAVAEDVTTGERIRIRADYLVGADGAGSTVRRLLGVERQGRGTVFNALSIYFRAPELEELLKDRKFILCYASAPGTLMGLSRLHGCNPWLAAPIYFPEKGEKPEDFTDERCVDIVRTAAGKADMAVEVVAKIPWEGAQLVAETFRRGRVFLAGDAAHVHPPAGGFGANTGIHDAHNLAWKLAAVLAGWGGGALLDTYHAERHAVGSAMAAQALVRNRIRHGYATEEDKAAMVDDIIVTLGYRYSSTAVSAPADRPVLTPELRLEGEPGTRAPHVWLDRDGERLSTIDLFWDHYVLLTDAAGTAWREAAAKAAEGLGIPLRTHVLGEGGGLRPVDRDWRQAYGIGPGGAVLVRPDAIVAWRSAGPVTDAADPLDAAIARAAGHLG